MSVFEVASLVVVSAGAFFLLIGSVGVIRLPDFYARAHATGKSDTLGLMLVLAGLAIHEGFTINSAKLAVALVFVVLTSPVGTHALTRAAYQSGLRPWFKGVGPPTEPAALAVPPDAPQEGEE
jgi:multicomponent Na+:H+ antiporter subunit G